MFVTVLSVPVYMHIDSLYLQTGVGHKQKCTDRVVKIKDWDHKDRKGSGLKSI